MIATLRQQLVIVSVILRGFRFFKGQVLKILPHFRISRLPPLEKKAILDALEKFKAAGGLTRDFAKAIGRSPATLASSRACCWVG